jgi:hypothetical protein
MTQMNDTAQFFQSLRVRLAQKGYAEIGPVQPLNIAFFKHGALSLPYVIAVIDTAGVSNTPTEVFKRVEGWLQQLHGRTGAACLLFLYHGAPPITTVEEIQRIGGYVTAGAHDLHSGEHWLSDNLGWKQDIYG